MNVTTPTGQNNNLQPSLNSEEYDNCSICLATLKGKEVKTTNCDHSFHKTCLDVWLKENNNCPQCLTDLKERDLQPSPAPGRFTPENQSLQENEAFDQQENEAFDQQEDEAFDQQEDEPFNQSLLPGITAWQQEPGIPRRTELDRKIYPPEYLFST